MKRLIPSFLLLLLFLLSMAGTGNPPAEKVYFNRMNEAVSSPEEAVGWITHQELDSGKVVQRTWYLDGQMNSEKHFVIAQGYTLAHGTECQWNQEGQLVMQAEYLYGRLHGMLRTWDVQGQLRREDEYAAGLLQKGRCLDAQGQELPWTEYHVPAQFAGGQQALRDFVISNLHFPYKPWQMGLEGIVQVRVLVDSLGHVAEAVALTELHPDLQAEAVRLVMSMPPWQPASKDGQQVGEVVDMQIRFRLEGLEGLYTPRHEFEFRQQPGDTLYFDNHQLVVFVEQVAHEYMVTEATGGDSYVQRTWSMEDILLEETHYTGSGEDEIVLHGPSRKWSREGQQLLDMMRQDNELHGTLLSWWPNGQLRRHDEYRKGEWLRGTCYDALGNEVPHHPYYTPAEFPGGDQGRYHHIVNHLSYPARARETGTSGTVYVKFTIGAQGDVREVAIDKGVSPELNEEAMKMVWAMPRWKPALLEGQPVESRMNMPVRFVLN